MASPLSVDPVPLAPDELRRHDEDGSQQEVHGRKTPQRPSGIDVGLVRVVRIGEHRDLIADPVAPDHPLLAQVRVLLMTFGSIWGLSAVLFAIHLMLAGYLIYRSGYIPKWVGILLAIAGLGYVVQNLNAYLFPEPDLRYVDVALAGEFVFMLWLLVRGWKIQDPAMPASAD